MANLNKVMLIGRLTRDPEVRSKTKETARSFGSAVAETFRDLSGELEKAVKKPAEKK